MKAKAICCRDLNARKRFFLLMIAPLLIGLMISLTTAARAGSWTTKDPLLNNSPASQGWKAIKIHDTSPKKKGEEEKYIPQ
jgi:hypothetical protein